MRLLLVDDDAGLRALVSTTFELVDIDVDAAEDASAALASVGRELPDVIVLDVSMPGMDGYELCRRLKSEPATRDVPVIMLSGTAEDDAESGADAFLTKPFSPLQLLAVAERLAGGAAAVPLGGSGAEHADAQLLLYARDLRRLLELERGQRAALQSAYQETVLALATALESKDTGTREHSQRVQLYALEPPRTAAGHDLLGDESVEYGFLLHDVGKIGIPDRILQKPGPLTEAERDLMQTHTVIGEQMLGGVAFLSGAGIAVVRHHHERWDGSGYPDGLEGSDIPLGARVFAVADALDAMTSDRPYRRALPWDAAAREILAESGRQFDPAVVRAFTDGEPRLRAIRRQLAAA